MASVNFYDKENYGGNVTSVYTDTTMGESSSVELSYDSIKMAGSSWLVVWNGQGYTGDYLLLNPGEVQPDLNNVPRTGGGDWKDQIKSFQLYAHQPSWWSTGVPPQG